MSSRQLRSPRFNNALDNPGIIIVTNAAASITSTTALGSGTILNSGNSLLTARGFVWATHTSPTLADNVVVDGATTIGTYTDTMSGLPSSTTIYYDAYATNASGTVYGGDQSFATSGGGGAAVFSSTLMLLGVG